MTKMMIAGAGLAGAAEEVWGRAESKNPGEFEQKNVGEFKHSLIIIESNAAIQITYKITMSHNMGKLWS